MTSVVYLACKQQPIDFYIRKSPEFSPLNLEEVSHTL